MPRAEANKVGDGRNDPNVNPFLPPPVGRLKFTLNPFAMINQLIGPEMRRKFYCCCCMVLCIALCVMMGPLIASNIVSNIINPLNW